MPISNTAFQKMAIDYTAAWNSKFAAAVASFFTEDGEIVVNNGELWRGRKGVEAITAGFYADVPDLALVCDDARLSGGHALYVWTFTGHDARTGAPLEIHGWAEWELAEDLKIRSSRGWFDAEDYAAQAGGA